MSASEPQLNAASRSSKNRIRDIAWVVGGAAVTALGTLLGVRLLTQVFPPAIYGVVSLALAGIALALTLTNTPLTQAAIHFYPELAAQGAFAELRASLQRCLRQMAVRAAPLILCAGIAYVSFTGESPLLIVLAIALLVSDSWRAANVSILNAARRHRRYALWTACDAWSKPLLAIAIALAFDIRAAPAVLAAYLAASLALNLVFSFRLWRTPPTAHGAATLLGRELDRKMWVYALPLIPLGVIGWATSLADRYVIAGVLGTASVGVYAAVYGLSSMPFMLVNGTIEQALRPAYQSAVSAQRDEHAKRLFRLWLLTVVSICGLGVLVVTFFHADLAEILLGPQYRHASALMPWISAGYAIRCASYVFERVCYAHGATKRVLVIQTYAAIAALITAPAGAWGWGLAGVAVAVPVYFTVQLGAAVALVRNSGLALRPRHVRLLRLLHNRPPFYKARCGR